MVLDAGAFVLAGIQGCDAWRVASGAREQTAASLTMFFELQHNIVRVRRHFVCYISRCTQYVIRMLTLEGNNTQPGPDASRPGEMDREYLRIPRCT